MEDSMGSRFEATAQFVTGPKKTSDISSAVQAAIKNLKRMSPWLPLRAVDAARNSQGDFVIYVQSCYQAGLFEITPAGEPLFMADGRCDGITIKRNTNVRKIVCPCRERHRNIEFRVLMKRLSEEIKAALEATQ